MDFYTNVIANFFAIIYFFSPYSYVVFFSLKRLSISGKQSLENKNGSLELGLPTTASLLLPPKVTLFSACSAPPFPTTIPFVWTLQLLRLFPSLKKYTVFDTRRGSKCCYSPLNQNTFQNVHHLLGSLTNAEESARTTLALDRTGNHRKSESTTHPTHPQQTKPHKQHLG